MWNCVNAETRFVFQSETVVWYFVQAPVFGGPVQALVTFQNTGTAPFSKPLRLLRQADGGRYWPSGMNGTDSKAHSWISATGLFRATSSLLSNQALRIASIFSSLGQPNQASLPFPRRAAAKIGSP